MIGRQWITDKVMSYLKRKQNTLVLGPAGIGKTTLLQHIAAQLGENCHYIENPTPPKAILQETYITVSGLSPEQLKQVGMTKWTLNRLTDEIIQQLSNRDFVLVMDTLDKVTASSSAWLTAMAESNITLLGACCEPKKTQQLKRFFWSFQKVQLEPMSDAEIKELVRQQVYPTGQSGPVIQFEDKATQRYFVQSVIKAAKGIPLTAVELCKRAAGVGKVRMSFVSEHLLDYSASVRWVAATPFYLAVLCIVFVMRYVARGMADGDAYVFWGSLSAIALFTRYFIMRGNRR